MNYWSIDCLINSYFLSIVTCRCTVSLHSFLTSFLASYLMILSSSNTRPSIIGELICLAKEKDGVVMNNVATNLIWMVMLCSRLKSVTSFGCYSGYLTGMSFGCHAPCRNNMLTYNLVAVFPFLLSSGSDPRPAAARGGHVSAHESCSIPATLNCGGS